MTNRRELGEREMAILATVVRQYITSGVPVGSKAVADQSPESLSPATIRNCMAELQFDGFLKHPHVSAGRVPTDKAYRFYVDRMVGSSRLPPETQSYIESNLTSEAVDPERLMGKISHVLAEVSHNVGLVLGPALKEKLLEHVKFVKLPDHRILAVIVSKPDLVENRILRLDDDDVSQQELDRTADYLNGEFRGWSLDTIRLEIFKRLEEMKHLCDELLSNVAKLLMWGALAEETPGPLFVEGTAKFLNLADFEDVQKIKRLLMTFEEKAKLVKILSACFEGQGAGVRIFIGKENPTLEMRECALIMAPYRYRNRVVGALGVVGPTRMEYDRAITTVDYVSHLCSKLLSAN
jgi:heat-inducible transcriptional repressor